MAERTPLFLLSGLMCDATVWSGQTEALAEMADITVVDFPGFDSIGSMAESVLARAPARFAVAGHSMGGRVALEIVRQAPERVSALALLNTGVHPRRPNEAEGRQALIDLARSEGMEALAKRWLPPMVHPARVDDDALMIPLAEMICRSTLASFEGQVRALLNRPDATPVLETIRCPTLVLSGRQDAWSPPEQHEPMAAAIPGAVLTLIEECGHMSLVERPEAVSAALKDWLRNAR